MKLSRILLVAVAGAVAIGASALALHAPDEGGTAESSAPLFKGARIDAATLRIFERSCQDCHSQRTRRPWYSRLPPASWMLERDVEEARSHVNFSQWDRYNAEEQRALLGAIGAASRNGIMPPARYVLLHSGAELAPVERRLIYEWTRSERARFKR